MTAVLAIRTLREPFLNLKYVERYCFELSEKDISTVDPSDFQFCQHFLVINGCRLVVSINKLLEEAKNLRTFYSRAFNCKLDWQEFIDNHSKLTEINISQATFNFEEQNTYPDACIEIGRLSHLQKISLPLYCMFEIKSALVVAEYFEKAKFEFENPNENENETVRTKEWSESVNTKRRLARTDLLTKPNLISGLDYLSVSCPEVDELEIGFTTKEVTGKLLIGSLSSIRRWTQLKKLTLDGLPILNGQFLIDITKNCINLISIRLKDLGPSGKCVFMHQLCVALNYCSKLKDFRLEQKYIGSATPLFLALQSCSRLERLYLCSSTNDRPLESIPVLNLMDQCRKLFVVYITLGSATKSACLLLRKQLELLYKATRPALSIVIQNKLDEDIVQYYAVHYREMVCFIPSVCSFNSFPNSLGN